MLDPVDTRAGAWLERAWKIALAALVIYILVWLDGVVPARHLFWKPLDPAGGVGAATRAQLLRVALSPDRTCRALADGAEGLVSRGAEAREGEGPCGWEVARLVETGGGVTLAGESTMQCPLALGVHLWLGEVERAAREHLGEKLARVHHFGTYSCRRQYGRAAGSWSEHAFANAWDVASFETRSGRVVSVLRGWNGADDERAFLRAARDAACDVFRVTLSPDYNSAHADHFHLDMGPRSACR